MTLNSGQLQALRETGTVRIPGPELGADCVIMRADIFERVAAVFDDALGPEEVGRFIKHNMREFYEDDPLLDLCQSDRQ